MRIAVYVRVSSLQQAQNQTIEQQLERLQTHCQQQQWPWSDVQMFRDDGESSATLRRPG
jgi:DNA invertase Pin-like site-specific DNA recombinase